MLEWPLHLEVNEVIILYLLRGTCTRAELANISLTCRPLHGAWLNILQSNRFIKALGSWNLAVAGSGRDGMSRLLRLGARGIPDIVMDTVQINQSKRKTSNANGQTNLGHKHKAPDHNHEATQPMVDLPHTS